MPTKKSEELRPQYIKQPLKMEVKVLVPWMIILVLAALIAGIATGWVARSNQQAEIKAAVSEQLAQLQPKK